MNCVFCGKQHDRKKFCSNTCKDRYHNKNNPRGFRTISKFEKQEMEFDAAMDGATGGWDEGGWLSDDFGCSKF